MCSARLASRLPPRLRRWRTTFPEEASTGETPQRLAKEASLLNLWGLSPATIRSVAAWSVPMAGKETNSGAPAPPADRAGRPARRSPRREPRNGGPPNGARTWLPPTWSRGISETEAAGHRDELLGREPAQAVAQGSGAVTTEALELVGGLRSGLHRGAAGGPQSPDHLHATVRALGLARRLAGQYRPGGGLGVRGVGLAVALEVAALGPLDFRHRDRRGPQVAGDPAP